MTMPAPSPQPTPSASSENALHRPLDAMPPCSEKSRKAPGRAMTATPPASAIVHSPARRACTAWCRATRDEEQAVSTVTAGPVRPRQYEMRPETTEEMVPVSRYPFRL